jgi:phosphoglycolate phosphatase
MTPPAAFRSTAATGSGAGSPATGPAVLFDMDGTLIDTPAGILRALASALAEAGASVPVDRMRATIGRPLAASLAALLALPEQHAAVTRAVARYRELFTELVVPGAPALVFPGIPGLLADLRAQGRPLAVVTSKVQRSAEELLGAAGLRDCFDAVICHGMAERGKPHPDLALLAAGVLGVPADRCVVVGDAVDDMRMAVTAGMTGYGVSYGVASPRELYDAGATLVLDSVAEFAATLSPATGRVATAAVSTSAGTPVLASGVPTGEESQ